MAVFVLVHGGFHGGWCWRKVTPLLQAAGHAVYTPTLTGLGERAHLLTSAVNLSTHIQDIVNVLVYEDLHGVILLGHSYAGMVIPGVAEVVPERLGQLVYLDAVVPDDGQSFFDTVPAEVGTRWTAHATELGEARVYPSSAEHWALFLRACSITEPEDVAWMEPRLTPHPLATMEEPVRLGSSRAAQIPSSYIRCSAGPADEAAEMAGYVAKITAQGGDYAEVHADHEVMITAPRELVALLVQIAAGLSGHP